MERKLRYLEGEIVKERDIHMIDQDPVEAPKPKEMIDLETSLEQLEHDLQEVNSNKDALKKNYLELQELRHILTKATHFFEEVRLSFVLFVFACLICVSKIAQFAARSHPEQRRPRQHGHLDGGGREESAAPLGLHRRRHRPRQSAAVRAHVVAHLSRQCVLAHGRNRRDHGRSQAGRTQYQILNAKMNETKQNKSVCVSQNVEVSKTVFIIFFQGEQLKSKVKKICDGYNCKKEQKKVPYFYCIFCL